ncbi:hypothetical protein [Spirulina subsalsa]|uniref:hypothetical protein n=1 Tax=Spirulina subsalsa TaxID=54311 RepID=UPI0002D2DF85|nr:hypothetical protein [Spirulina subsalsa]
MGKESPQLLAHRREARTVPVGSVSGGCHVRECQCYKMGSATQTYFIFQQFKQ